MQVLFMPIGQSKTEAAFRYLALGDSYTIGESVPSADRFPSQLVGLLRSEGLAFSEPEFVATTGWTTGDLIRAIRSYPFQSPYDLVTLLIGVNNQYQGRGLSEYARDFRTLLNQAIELAARRPARVITLSIPDYAYTHFASGSDITSISRMIDEFNMTNREITDELGCRYVSVTEESRMAREDETMIAADGLHYSGKEYAIWAKKLMLLVQSALRSN